LSTAAQAGIGVGVAVGALLLAAVAYLLWKLKRTQRMVQASPLAATGSQAGYSPGVEQASAPLYQPAQAYTKSTELPGWQGYEMQS
jgi:hypothetical protein